MCLLQNTLNGTPLHMWIMVSTARQGKRQCLPWSQFQAETHSNMLPSKLKVKNQLRPLILRQLRRTLRDDGGDIGLKQRLQQVIYSTCSQLSCTTTSHGAACCCCSSTSMCGSCVRKTFSESQLGRLQEWLALRGLPTCSRVVLRCYSYNPDTPTLPESRCQTSR